MKLARINKFFGKNDKTNFFLIEVKIMLSDQLKQLEGSPTAKFFRLAKEREAHGHDIIHLEIGQPDFQPLPEERSRS